MHNKAIKTVIWIVGAVSLCTGACAPDKGSRSRPRMSVDSPAAVEEQKHSEPSSQETARPQESPTKRQGDSSTSGEGGSTPVTPQPLETSPEVFVEGTKGFKFEPFQLPDVIIDRKRRRGEEIQKPNELYEMHEAHLVIDLSRDKMVLDVDLEADGDRRQMKLEGEFDRQGRSWLSNLYAVDPVLKAERRIQAVVYCLRPFICDQIWMDLYYLVKGELKRRQFVVGAEKPRITLSETTSVPLPEVNSEGMLEIPPTPVIEDHDSERNWEFPPPEPVEPDDNETAADDSVPLPLPPPPQEEDAQSSEENSAEASPATEAEEKDGRPQTDGQDEARIDESIPQMPEVEQGPPQVVVPYPRPRPEFLERQTIPVDDATIEYSTELQLPPPEVNDFSVQGAELLQIHLSERWAPQAKGSHTNGYLENATLMTHHGCGFKRRDTPSRPVSQPSEDTTASWGTDLMMEMLAEAACVVERKKSGHPLLVGNISIRRGGKYGSHSSHQTGLDADLGFYHRNRDITSYWRPLEENFEQNFDYERNWTFLKALHSTAEQRLMIVFVDHRIKAKLCNWVKQNEGLPTDPDSAAYKALRHLRHWDGHANHYHIRLFCPGTSGCLNRDADPNFSGTGC